MKPAKGPQLQAASCPEDPVYRDSCETDLQDSSHVSTWNTREKVFCIRLRYCSLSIVYPRDK